MQGFGIRDSERVRRALRVAAVPCAVGPFCENGNPPYMRAAR
jgi:hypothetical protein